MEKFKNIPEPIKTIIEERIQDSVGYYRGGVEFKRHIGALEEIDIASNEYSTKVGYRGM